MAPDTKVPDRRKDSRTAGRTTPITISLRLWRVIIRERTLLWTPLPPARQWVKL
ncbi:hypothetical protein DPMN_060090 [Dreissena polymorpha]|uniref:Uncharacterized protein n=1 Tax=Dreissena polymorpha TaxID=45954 RepID=A0A9D4C536_DREPO|nr:hypothetical protein DPMN_060090 [Dreissena polymorpha]